MKRSPFTHQVVELIRAIPEGRVSSYGRIAALAGEKRGARQVVRVLSCDVTAPRLGAAADQRRRQSGVRLSQHAQARIPRGRSGQDGARTVR